MTDEIWNSDHRLDVPLLAQVHGEGAPEPKRRDRANRIYGVSMFCFTAINHRCDENHEELRPEGNEYRIAGLIGSWRQFIVDLALSLILPFFLSIQFYMVYQFYGTTAESDLSHRQAQTNLALYTVACLSYRFSCGSSGDYDMYLYFMPEIVSDGIALLLLLHCTWWAVTLTSVFAMAFAFAAVLNTGSGMMMCNGTEKILEGPRSRRGPIITHENDSLDVTYHNRLAKPTLV